MATMTHQERYYRDWLKRHAPESRVLAAYAEPAADPWSRVEIETDELGDTITREVTALRENIVLECLEGEQS